MPYLKTETHRGPRARDAFVWQSPGFQCAVAKRNYPARPALWNSRTLGRHELSKSAKTCKRQSDAIIARGRPEPGATATKLVRTTNMSTPAIHFATQPKINWASNLVATVPLISATTMAGVPTLVREVFGNKVIAKANRDVMLDIELIEDQDCFIPQATMAAFGDSIARQVGEEDFGLLLSPSIDIADYGLWGRYLLETSALKGAMERTIETLGYHSPSDCMALCEGKEISRVDYISAARPMVGYRHVAQSIVGLLLGMCQTYLGPDWRPRRIEFDLPRPRRTTGFEDAFGCPVIFNAPRIALCLSTLDLGARRPSSNTTQLITLEDLMHARRAPDRSDGVLALIKEQIWSQVLAGTVSIESTARAFDTGVRTLQRELNREGVAFRTLVNAARSQRAIALLRQSDASVTSIAMQLGYSTPSNFTRAFRTATGHSPMYFCRAERGGSGKLNSRKKWIFRATAA